MTERDRPDFTPDDLELMEKYVSVMTVGGDSQVAVLKTLLETPTALLQGFFATANSKTASIMGIKNCARGFLDMLESSK